LSARGAHVFSLRTKLVVFAAALVVIPGAIYGAITVSRSREAMARVVGRQFVEGARNAADQLATMLRSEQERIHWLAAQDVMREIRIGDFDKRISSLLASAKKSCPACVDLFVVDEQRRVVASSNPAWIGRTEGDPPGRDGARETIEGPLRTASGGRPILRLTVPVPDLEAPESQLGWLAALLDWERASEAISRVRKHLLSGGLDGEVLIVDARGRVIGGAGRPGGPWRPGDSLDPRLLEADDPASASRIDSSAGMLFGTARLPDTLPPWRVVVAQPLAEAFAPVYRTATLLGTALAGTLLAALAIALVAARRVTRPLAELTAAAEAVGRAGGGPPPIVRLRSRDEIGTLTAAFNRMAIDLRRAERELVDAAKFAFVGELAAGVAHEVRTPLGVLRSSTQLLERSLDAKDDEARELLELLRVEVDRIERVVSGLLELGRPRELRPEPAAVGQIVFRAADFVEAQAREKHISIRRHPVVPDPEALCDPELVYQIALNLLVNAVQILSDGGSVDVGLLPPRDGYVGFEVKDDGPGMSEEIRARIFEPYYTRRNGGAGLGLTFVRRVVQEHRGRIFVESTPGSGAVFRVELPVPGASA
jgi:two-component system, NtrC family, sensor histidine kinase HydH